MQTVNENLKQIEDLSELLEDMKNYLYKVEQGCQELLINLHVIDKSESLNTLVQVMEGLGYYEKLLKSAAVLLNIDFSEILYQETSAALLFDQLREIFANIYQAVENEDYSLLSDNIEYDLLPAINISQGILITVQKRHGERAR